MKKLLLLLLFIPLVSFGQNLNGYKYVFVPQTQYQNGQYDIWGISQRSKDFFQNSNLKVLTDYTGEAVEKLSNPCEAVFLNIEHTNVIPPEYGWNYIYYKFIDCNNKVILSITGRGKKASVMGDFRAATKQAFKSLEPYLKSYVYVSSFTPKYESDVKFLNSPNFDSKSEVSIRKYFDKKRTNTIEGIWEYSSTSQQENSYKLAITKSDYKFNVTILESNGYWKPGEIKAEIEPSAAESIMTVRWTMGDKKTTNKVIAKNQNNALLEFKINGSDIMLYRVYPTLNKTRPQVTSSSDGNWSGNGSGVIISKSGYIITNHHVIEDADDIEVEFILNDEVKKFNAEIVQVDKTNDLAIIKIFDMNFDGVDELPYNFKTRSSDVGTKVYAFGYPMALSIMGKEIKVTDGMISSKTGFDGDITTYQITAPIQGGNSGGPLFDEKGNLIGINSSGIRKDVADNVAYSIKTSYVLNLIDILPKSIELPSNTKLESLPLTEQIKEISKYVVLIKVK
ncbi:trypsin-like peptidase domain-containing protein [Flavobacteriaceae bacterium]|nr:trypsin-like peptidase domain-containing protein [Flavobacteriaceae bacterium]